MTTELHTIIEMTQYKNPLSNYAKGVRIELETKMIEVPLDPNWEPRHLEEIWTNRDSYHFGKAQILWFTDTRVWGKVIQITPNPNYIKPIDNTFDIRSARKMFDNLNIMR